MSVAMGISLAISAYITMGILYYIINYGISYKNLIKLGYVNASTLQSKMNEDREGRVIKASFWWVFTPLYLLKGLTMFISTVTESFTDILDKIALKLFRIS